MALSELRTALNNALVVALPGWAVATSAIPFAKDLLVEVVWLDSAIEMVEMPSTVAVRGNLGIILYRRYDEDYTVMVDAIDTIASLLPTLNFGDTAVGNQTPILGNVSSPSIASDGRSDFRVVVIAVPVEVLI